MRLYLAAPLFTQAERRWLRQLAAALRKDGHRVFLPQETAKQLLRNGPFNPAKVFEANRRNMDVSDIVIAVLDGPDADSGAAWECGYATGRGKPVIGIRTDFRGSEDDGLNIMLRRSISELVKHQSLDESVGTIIRQLRSALKRFGSANR